MIDYYAPTGDLPAQRNDDFMAQKYFGPGGIVLIEQVAAALPDIYRLLQEMDRIHALIEELEALRNMLNGIYSAPTIINGVNGKSAFELAQDAGFTGTLPQWLASLHSPPTLPGANGSNADYAIAGFAVANILASEVLTDHEVVRACTLAANFFGSAVSVGTNPAASFVLRILRNGILVGTITISTAGGVLLATVNGAPVPLAVGDILSVIAPATVDPSIARLRYTLKGN